MILVTGGAGFIGSCLVAALETVGQDVTVCDRLGDGEKWRNVARRRNLAGVVSPDRLLEWLEGRRLDAVFHLGAITDTTSRDADEMVSENVGLSESLLRWCSGSRGKMTPFVYASSAATYGLGPFDDDAPLDALAPMSLYGWSKHLFDLLVERGRRDGELPRVCAGLKFFNVFGPNEYHKDCMASVPCRAAKMKRETGSIFPIFERTGGVEPARDFVCVDDAVRVLIWALSAEVSGIYNVGTGVSSTFADMVRAVGCSDSQRIQIPDRLRGQYQLETRAETTKLRRAGCEIKFEPAVLAARRYRRHYERVEYV